jgi:putative heme iron utilization protein
VNDLLYCFARGLDRGNVDLPHRHHRVHRALAGIEATEATMTSVDRLGFSLRLKTNSGIKGARINFLQEVATPQDTRAALVEMVRQAKARG